MDAIKKTCDVVGSQRELAKILGITSSAISQWSIGGVPIDRCIDIEKATAGAVTCEDLRPDVDWAYLRNSSPIEKIIATTATQLGLDRKDA